MKKGDKVTVNVPGSRILVHASGTVQEVIPPNCVKVYIIHAKAYFMIREEYCKLKNGGGNAAQKNLPL